MPEDVKATTGDGTPPKGSAGATAVEPESKKAPDAGTSSTSSSATQGATSKPEKKPDPLDVAAKAERHLAKEREKLDARAAEVEKKGKEADEKLAKLAKLALADEHMSKGQIRDALKAIMAEAYDPSKLLEILSLDVDVSGIDDETGKPKEKSVKEQLEELLAEKAAAKKKEEDDAAEAKKSDDAKTAEEDYQLRVKAFRQQTDDGLSKEKHPMLAAAFEKATDFIGEDAAKKALQDQAIAKWFWVLEKKGEKLHPNEILDIMEAERKIKAAPKPKDDLEAALAEIDKKLEAARVEDNKTSAFRLSDDIPKPKARAEMTAMELAEMELDERDRRVVSANGKMF
jgi:hypothetical protein